MNIALFIARKLQLKGSKRHTSSSSSIIAVSGVAIAIFVMVLTLCVVHGFKNEIKDKVCGFDSQITINPPMTVRDSSDLSIKLNDTLRHIINTSLNDSAKYTISLTVDQPGVMKTEDNFAGLIFKGIDANSNLSFINSNLIEGVIPDYSNDSCKNKIVISSNTASSLDIKIGDKINTYFFTDNNIRARKFEISGIYNSNFGEYDKIIAYASLPTLQRIARLDSLSGTSITINNLNNDDITNLSISLHSAINEATYTGKLEKLYYIDNVLHTGAMYFNWLDLLDTNVIVILALMGCVAGFTLISCLFIIILERVKTIGLLKALGATNTQVRHVFIHMAQRLVLRGMLIGNILSISFLLLQQKYHLIPLNPEAYYLNHVPVEINWTHIILLNVAVIAIASLILILPSYLVSRISPAQTMRYE